MSRDFDEVPNEAGHLQHTDSYRNRYRLMVQIVEWWRILLESGNVLVRSWYTCIRGPRPGEFQSGGEGDKSAFLVGIWPPKVQKFKFFCGLQTHHKGDSHLLTAASRPRAILSSAFPV
jgi:hypothetical protein